MGDSEAIKVLKERRSQILWRVSKLNNIASSLESAIRELEHNDSKSIDSD